MDDDWDENCDVVSTYFARVMSMSNSVITILLSYNIDYHTSVKADIHVVGSATTSANNTEQL